MNQIKKQISILLSIALITGQLILPYRVMAQPVPPTAPTAPSAPEPTQAPSAPTPAASAPTPPPQPNNPAVSTPTPEPTSIPSAQVTPTVGYTPTPAQQEVTNPTQTAVNENTGAGSTNDSSVNNDNQTTITTNSNADINNDLVMIGSTGGNFSDKNTGDAVINTGDVTIGGSVENVANQTVTSVPTCGATSCSTIVGGQVATNSNTGSDSNNNSSSSNNNATTVTNNNSADLDTGLIAIAETGRNSASKNTGSAYIESGDANVGLTVVNVANTDITGVKTSEFNVIDNYQGDIVIDFANLSATPINGNGSNASNNQTGADSNNNAVVDNNTALTVVNNNDAQVVSDLVVDAVTGYNRADKNTGDAMVKSGDANIVTNVVNLVNNTLTSGAEILVATVNVFGDWIGDLILTDSSNNLANCSTCSQSANATNGQTGADSNNTSAITGNKVTTLETNNTAEIGNGIVLNATTGTNFVDDNTGGGQVSTGDVNAVASANTVANNNTDGGTWWLVIVNEAGRWVGHILGADDSGNLAQAGSVDLGASNETTGADSNNNSAITNNESTSQIMNNNANVDTNIVINADTGHNSASKNTESGSINTGDVNVASNIVNFVNNNFSGGKVILTFVNVFGSWIGDAITPNGTVDGANGTNNENAIGGVIDDVITIDNSDSSLSANTNNNEDQNQSSESEVNTNTSSSNTFRTLTSRKQRVFANARSYVLGEETSARIASGQWLIDVDQTITVTPSPVASVSMPLSDDSSVWWRIFAGLSISLLAAVSSHFRQMMAWIPKN